MANTIPDILIVKDKWNDVYSLTGIMQGTHVILKNKSSNNILVVISPTSPAASFQGGWDIAQSDWAVVTGIPEGSKVWVKGEGRLFVQVDE